MLGFARLSGHGYADATVDVLGATHEDVDDGGFTNCREINDRNKVLAVAQLSARTK